MRRKQSPKAVSLSRAKNDLSRLLREAVEGDVVITRRGRPAGVLIGFDSDEEWFEYRLASDPDFPRRIERRTGAPAAERRMEQE
jgi:prevent-host-death family protein